MVGWLTTRGELAGNALVYSSVYLSVIAMTEVAIAMVLFSLPASPAPLIVGLVTYAIYTNDHLKDDPIHSRRAAFVNRYRDAFYLTAAGAYGLAIALSVLGGPLAVGLTLVPGLFWVVYASGEIPGLGFEIRRLKETVIVNTVLVALAWATALTFLPVAFADRPAAGTLLVVFGYFLLRSTVDTIIPNVRDRLEDIGDGVRTVPLVLGLTTTRRLLYLFDVASALLVWAAVNAGLLSVGIGAALGLGLAYSLVLVTLLGRIDADDLLAIGAEFEYVIVALALLGVSAVP